MAMQPVDLAKAYRLLNHGPTVLVTAAHAGQRNVMAAAWNMPLDFQPPKVAVVIDRNTFTRSLIDASGRFGLVAGCLAWLLCRLVHEPDMAVRHDLFLAEVTAAWADPAAFSDGRWHMPADESQRSIHHVAGGAFFVTGSPIQSG